MINGSPVCIKICMRENWTRLVMTHSDQSKGWGKRSRLNGNTVNFVIHYITTYQYTTMSSKKPKPE
jgi:hypothetical protein